MVNVQVSSFCVKPKKTTSINIVMIFDLSPDLWPQLDLRWLFSDQRWFSGPAPVVLGAEAPYPKIDGTSPAPRRRGINVLIYV